MNKKYELTDETIKINCHVLHRIKSLSYFNDVIPGKYGGFIEKEENLSHRGTCWVYDNAKVFGDGLVMDDATIHDKATVRDRAKISGYAVMSGESGAVDSAVITDNTRICDKANIGGESSISGNAIVRDSAMVWDHAVIAGNAVLCEEAKMYGRSMLCNRAYVRGISKLYDKAEVWGNAIIINADIYENACITSNAIVIGCEVHSNAVIAANALIESANDYMLIGPIGSRNGFTTFYLDKGKNIMVKCGCFNDTIDRFEERVRNIHGENKHGLAYLSAIGTVGKVLKTLREEK